MKVEANNILRLTFKNKDAEKFRSIVKKMDEERRRVGFNKTVLTESEAKFLEDLKMKLNP